MKATGTEINEFYRDWPVGDDWCHDDGSTELLDDQLDLVPTERYDLDDAIGCLCWQGRGDEPSHVVIRGKRIRTGTDRFLVEVFRAWRGDCVSAVVILPSSDLDELRTVAIQRGWKVST